ncbi:hypothetical protein ABT160_42440 [Streptomyces sp. NPDC001941]|uniref:hypothetical protein n=1 Tax=Streptomyces sp. NPDC001941 TaxID=3154659 RepID=UPI00332CBA9B
MCRDGSDDLVERYGDEGLHAFYRADRLVALYVEDDGPQVLLDGIALVGRPPSLVRDGLEHLAQRCGAAVATTWSGDAEVPAWGVSMGAATRWAPAAVGGYCERTDQVTTEVLLCAPELANDPYNSDTVIMWQDVREVDHNPGSWPVRPLRERPRWQWTPLESVGPLVFGMGPEPVAQALGGERPAVRRGTFPYAWHKTWGVWDLREERFDEAGVSAHYTHAQDGPRPVLGAVTVHGRTRPLIAFEGFELVGQPVPDVDAALLRFTETTGHSVAFGCAGDIGPDEENAYVRADRAGDHTISGARFCSYGWEDHG